MTTEVKSFLIRFFDIFAYFETYAESKNQGLNYHRSIRRHGIAPQVSSSRINLEKLETDIE
jgi:hypothetical protein